MNVPGIIEWLYPDAVPIRDYRLEVKGDQIVIAMWNVPGVDQPTTDYLASREAEFNALPPDWRQRRQAVSLASSARPDQVLLRGVLQVIYSAFAADRAYMAALASEITKLGGSPPPAPGVRTFQELVALTAQAIGAGAGDPN